MQSEQSLGSAGCCLVEAKSSAASVDVSPGGGETAQLVHERYFCFSGDAHEPLMFDAVVEGK